MEAELAKALHWNGQVGGHLYRCDMMLSNCGEQVGQLSDRWRRLQAQIDTRYGILKCSQSRVQVKIQNSPPPVNSFISECKTCSVTCLNWSTTSSPAPPSVTGLGTLTESKPSCRPPTFRMFNLSRTTSAARRCSKFICHRDGCLRHVCWAI